MEQAITQVLGEALPIVGKAAKNLLGSFLHDTPPVKLDEAGDYAIVDLPKGVSSQAYSKDDVHDDQSAVISTIPSDTFRMTSILERCKIMSRITIVNWNETQVTGTSLFNTPVNPMVCSNVTAAGVTDFLHTALSFYGQLFSFWRGGIRFTIECLPTRFHQGQLYIAFNPNLAPFTLDGARNCTSATIDLGLNNRTTLDVPFVTQTDYLSVPQYPGNINPATLLESLGVFSIFVQNPLNSNGTVVTNIDVNVYIEMLDDFEYKAPRPFRPGTQQFVNGVWQMNEEVTVKELVNPPTHQASQGMSSTVDKNVAVAANVVTADTRNIMEREYLITHGVPLAATDGAGTLLQTMNLPSEFWNTSLATSGLFQYHELYRMDFHVTLRINPTSFHQGALMFVWIPLDLDLTNYSFGTLTQFPHAILNIAAETSASFDIPYSHMIRFLRGTTPDFGALKVFVWNQMKAPSTAPQILYFSIWVQALNPHMAVKRQAGAQVFGELQMNEVSDTARNVATSQVAFQPAGQSSEGFIKTDHMNVLSLLRRPCAGGATALVPTTVAPTAYSNIWNTTSFFGNEHCAIVGTYLASAGSNRIIVASSAGRAVNLTMFSTVFWETVAPPNPSATLSLGTTTSLGNVFYGGKQWQPGREQQKVLEVPFYRQYPLVAHWAQRENYVTGWPLSRIGYVCRDSATAFTVTAYVYHAVGDDFMVYYPICFFQTRLVPVIVDDAEQQLIRSGDIELNPGPDDGCSDVDDGDWQKYLLDDEIICGELQMFSGISNVFNSINNVGNAAKIVEEKLPSVAESVLKASNSVNSLFSSDEARVVQSLASGDSKLFDLLQKWKTAAEMVLHGVVHLYNIWNGGLLRAASLAALVLMLSGYVSEQLLNQLKKIVVPSGGSGEMQSNGLLHTFLSIAPGMCKAILNLWNFEMGEDETKCFSYRLSEKTADCKGVAQTLMAIGETIVEYVFEGVGFCLDWYKLSSSQLSDFSREVAEAKATHKYTTITLRNVKVQSELRKLYKLAKKIKSYGPQVDRFSMQYLRDAENVCSWMQLSPVPGASARCPPIGVAFVGDSGTGKSFLASSVFSACLMMKTRMAESADEALELVWPKPTGSDTHFYDGYAQQPITYIDDFLKTVEAVDAQDVINMISSSQYPLDMAKLEDKGMLFKSDFVIVTSNTRNYASVHGLSHPDALCERFKCAYEVKQKRVVVDGKQLCGGDLVAEFTRRLEDLDEDEIHLGEKRQVTMDHLIGLVDDFWEFKRVDVRGGHIREPITFYFIIKEVASAYFVKRDSYGRMIGSLKGIRFEINDDILDEMDDWQDVQEIYDRCDQILDNEQPVFTRFTPYYDKEDVPFDRYAEMVGFVRDAVEKGELEEFRSIALDHCRCWNIDPNKGRYFRVLDLESWPRDVVIEDVYAALLMRKTQKWKGLLAFCGLVAGAAIAGFGIWQIVKWLTKSFCGVLQGALYDSARTRPKPKVNPKGILEGVDNMHERTRKNIRVLDIFDMDDESSHASMYCLLLGSKWVLLPHHFWLAYSKKREVGWNVCVRIEHKNPRGQSDGWTKVALDPSLVRRVRGPDGSDLDLCVAYLHSANINGCRKLEDFIPRRKDFDDFCGKEHSTKILAQDDLDDVPIRIGVRDPVSYTVDGGIYTNRAYSVYMLVGDTGKQYTTRAGDCGRPYVTMSNLIRKPLIGIHSAKITSLEGSPTGCTPLIWEDIKEAMDSIVVPRVAPLEVKGTVEGNLNKNKFWNTSLHTEGQTEWNGVPLCSYTPTTTDKKRWLSHPDWEDNYLPSCKQVVEDRHALYTNAQKCIPKSVSIVPNRVMNMCVEHYASKFGDRDRTILTEHEMINGREPMLPLAQNTSCGFLSKWFKDGKKQIFDGIDYPTGKVFVWSVKSKEQIIPIYGTSIVDRVIAVENDLKNGLVPFMPWVATLKDELRPKEKVFKCKTRIFEQPPFEFTLLVRKYFGAFTNWIKSRPGFVTHSAIGIDKEQCWKRFYIGLCDKGKRGFDVDYSNYDGSVNTQAFDFFRMVTDRYYDNVCPVRHGLLYILQNSWVIVGDQLMYTEQGNKSGNPMTDLFNSITNVWVLYVCYLDSRVKVGLSLSLDDFDRDVAMLTYGDDVIVTAPDCVLQYFNRKTVAECAGQLGMTVTAASKEAELLESEDLKDLSFLKSKFVPNGSIVMAPMPPDVARRELQWIDKHNVHDSRIQRDIVSNAMRFMAHNGKEAVETLRGQLRQLGKESVFSYDDFRLEIYDKQSGDGCMSYLNLD